MLTIGLEERDSYFVLCGDHGNSKGGQVEWVEAVERVHGVGAELTWRRSEIAFEGVKMMPRGHEVGVLEALSNPTQRRNT